MHLSRGLITALLGLGASVFAAGCVGEGKGQIDPNGSGGTGQVEAGVGSPYDLCGNGSINAEVGEECDDGNRIEDPDSPCGADCRFVCSVGADGDARCNNGNFCDGDETCGDDHMCHTATAVRPDGVPCGDSKDCLGGACLPSIPVCGDGRLVTPEECDDGNQQNGDGCEYPSCKFTCVAADPTRDCSVTDVCAGTSTCLTDHTCQPRVPLPDYTDCGTLGAGNHCLSGACRPCGNLVVDAGEECDDGNTTPGDGCERNCKFTCLATDTTRNCSSGNPCLVDGTCSSTTHTCSAATKRPTGTSCGTAGSYCVSGSCAAAVCGDGIVLSGSGGTETCDDGNLDDKDGCTSTCDYTCTTSGLSLCGQAPSSCSSVSCTAAHTCSLTVVSPDPANCSNGGHCESGACTINGCGNGVPDAAEQCDLGTGGNGNGTGLGCETNCRWSCQPGGTDCNDGDDCNGTETCTQSTQGGQSVYTCVAGTPKSNGSTCGTGGRVCVNGGCARSICGDGVVVAPETCDPPNTVGCDGTCLQIEDCTPKLVTAWFATKTVMNVTWPDAPGAPDPTAVRTGSGVIEQLVLVASTQNPTNAPVNPGGYTLTFKPCGLRIPDFQAGEFLYNDWFGIEFPTPAQWDNGTAVFASQLYGASATPGTPITIDPFVLLMGVQMQDPYKAWADLDPIILQDGTTDYEQVDLDGDGKPGITGRVKTGPLPSDPKYTQHLATDGGPLQYSLLSVDVLNYPVIVRADEVQIVARAGVSENGTLDSCDQLSGLVNVTFVDNMVIDCHLVDGRQCYTPTDISMLQVTNAVKPRYNFGGSTFVSTRMNVTAAPGCAAVATAVQW